MSDFHYRGAIVRIRIQNFMTYTDTEIKPGPNLNMILGPNGTGKSAIVCCIIVGLAGDVSLTGRATTPADLIKKGTNYAVTEIELYNDKGNNFVVERKIILTSDEGAHKTEHKSEWKINSKKALQKDVTNLTKDLNIKVDNLCQFLPQDSVTQFVKMDSVELLVDTLKAAGDNQLVEDHVTLVEKTKEFKFKKTELQKLEDGLKQNEVNAERMMPEIHQLRRRDELVKKKKTCEKKKHYARYLDVQCRYEQAKKNHEQRKLELQQKETSFEPSRQSKEVHKREEQRIAKSLEETEKQISSSMNLIQNQQAEIEKKKLNCDEEFSKFKAKEREEKQRQSSITLKEQELEAHQARLVEARDVDCTNQIKSLESESEKIKSEIETSRKEDVEYDKKLNKILNEIEIKKRDLREVKSINEKKMNLLRQKYPDAFKMTDWMSKHQDSFSGKVYQPMMCEINVKDVKMTNVVEHAIGRQDFPAFLCEKPEDLTTLTRAARSPEMNARINVIMAPSRSRDSDFASQQSQMADLSSLGVKAFLKDLIDAPEPIIRYLCASSNFHRIPVAVSSSESQIQELMKHCPRFYVDNCFYNVTKSRYDNQSMTVKDIVRNAQHLHLSLDTERLANCNMKLQHLSELKVKLNTERETVMNRISQLKEEFEGIKQRVATLKNKQTERERLERLIAKTIDNIKQLKVDKIDLNEERRKLKQAIDNLDNKKLQIIDKMIETANNLASIQQNHMVGVLSLPIAKYNTRKADEKCQLAEAEIKELTRILRMEESTLRQLSTAMHKLRLEAEEKIPGFKDGSLDKATREEFKQIPENSEEGIREYILDLDAQIDRIHGGPGGNDILNEYKRNKRELEDKKAQIEEQKKDLESLKVARDAIKAQWLAKLDDVIKIIDENYKDFMLKLNYGGQVKLDRNPADIDDFSAYGITILVRYRDDQDLIPLSSTRQSGGERSVATMVYMLALQAITKVPFRCLDEINQGMDKTNERKVFEILVDTADSSSSQYFLVSPKLLPDLPYSEKMKIHVVFNGRKLDLAWGDSMPTLESQSTSGPTSARKTRNTRSRAVKVE